MKPDRSTFKVLPWCPTQASVMVDFTTLEGEPWKYCPRSMVKKAAKELKENHGLEMKIGFEIEFAMFNLEFSPVEFNGYCNANSLDLYAKILEDVTLTL
jgi:glutamine synthetase